MIHLTLTILPSGRCLIRFDDGTLAHCETLAAALDTIAKVAANCGIKEVVL